jgi:MoxR-like ATPase
MFNLWLDYPSQPEEVEIVRTTTSQFAPTVNRVLGGAEIFHYQDLVRRVPVAENVIEYAVRLVTKSRPKLDSAPPFIKQWLSWGAGPRASQYLILGAKTRAILSGRHTPDINDVQQMARPVLRHRLLPNFNAEADGVVTIDIVDRLVKETT